MKIKHIYSLSILAIFLFAAACQKEKEKIQPDIKTEVATLADDAPKISGLWHNYVDNPEGEDVEFYRYGIHQLNHEREAPYKYAHFKEDNEGRVLLGQGEGVVQAIPLDRNQIPDIEDFEEKWGNAIAELVVTTNKGERTNYAVFLYEYPNNGWQEPTMRWLELPYTPTPNPEPIVFEGSH